MSTTDRSTLPGPAPPILVGRERELGVVRQHLDGALAGQGSLVLIGGEAGIGKTALAEVVCWEAEQQGALVLTGRCFDLADTPPYGPWLYLFERYQPGDGPPLPPAFSEPGTVGDVTSQSVLFRQVLDFLKAVTTQRPVVLLLDDLHWADPASLDLVRFLGQSVVTLPMLIVVTYRSDELARRHPLSHLLPLLVREASATRVALHALQTGDIAALVRARYNLPVADADRLVDYLAERSEGNPFFLGELLNMLEEEAALRPRNGSWAFDEPAGVQVPPLLQQVIDARLIRLGDDAQMLLSVAAVIGHEVPLAVWAAVAETDEETLLDVVGEAGVAHLMVETPDGTGATFAHALIREAVYEGVSPARRRLLHRRIAELLTAELQPDPDAVASHFQRAADSRAVGWLVRAGERAQLAYAWLTAAARFETALSLVGERDEDLAEQAWLRYRIARLRRLSEPERSIAYLDEALRIATLVGDRTLTAAARYSRGSACCTPTPTPTRSSPT